MVNGAVWSRREDLLYIPFQTNAATQNTSNSIPMSPANEKMPLFARGKKKSRRAKIDVGTNLGIGLSFSRSPEQA